LGELNIDTEIDKVKGLISAIDVEGKGTIDIDETVNFVSHVRIWSPFIPTSI
jgi:hypothetical protein